MQQKIKCFLMFVSAISFLLLTACSSSDSNVTVEKEQAEEVKLTYVGEADPLEENELRIHYKRDAGDYENFVVWAWNDTSWVGLVWPEGLEKLGETNYGVYYDLPLKENPGEVGFLLVDKTLGDDGKDGGDKVFRNFDKTREIFVEQGSGKVFTKMNH